MDANTKTIEKLRSFAKAERQKLKNFSGTLAKYWETEETAKKLEFAASYLENEDLKGSKEAKTPAQVSIPAGAPVQ